MCLKTRVFENLCRYEEIRMAFFPDAEAFRDRFKTGVSIA